MIVARTPAFVNFGASVITSANVSSSRFRVVIPVVAANQVTWRVVMDDDPRRMGAGVLRSARADAATRWRSRVSLLTQRPVR